MGWADQRRAVAIGKGVNASVELNGLTAWASSSVGPLPLCRVERGDREVMGRTRKDGVESRPLRANWNYGHLYTAVLPAEASEREVRF